ncbi:uncharacterized protein ASCRUDRAFT_77634 [Ascoidea rubescens DSM 1968]|uniref:Secreted peptide n=1 Tax=Ascoidea rubescens DSM 1968 TaxID=1344418 RepID=A0A1D2VBE2_9ASCO|nr:hypothetical protein ASCRUDRAFT_77634 [Ascoidea rubescens DSM 1968]ODV58920.1 hypothetical protein ASCRUDRAFT_77634 [Ascoidea rubescens DSM 1968]
MVIWLFSLLMLFLPFPFFLCVDVESPSQSSHSSLFSNAATCIFVCINAGLYNSAHTYIQMHQPQQWSLEPLSAFLIFLIFHFGLFFSALL